MALLVQRVSGAPHKNYFFPDLAGVGLSHNTYVWNQNMDPKEGCLRLVFGMGTRAVNRVEGDYPRMVALSDPLRRPYAEKDDLRKYSQHEVDLINTKENEFSNVTFEKIISEKAYIDVDRVAVKDYEAMRMMSEEGRQDKEYWILTLDNLFSDNTLVDSFKKILKSLEDAYLYPVEIEFTVNFTKDNTFKINLLQCRPLQTRGLGKKVDMPKRVNKKDILFESQGYFLGGNISQKIAWIIYVDPKEYNKLGLSNKYEIARIVGKINRTINSKEELPALLMGPGRWGTTTPSLGIPVKFAEINNIAVLADVAFAAGNLNPDLSFGTHFFQDLVETDIFYVALFPEKKEVIFDNGWFGQLKNLFTELIPESTKYKDIIGVYDVAARNLRIMSDIVSQKIICFQSEGR
jgi:hypothetical protein